MDKELINYISRGRGAGVPDGAMRDVLLDAGWPVEEINSALIEAGSHLPIINTVPIVTDSQLEWTNVHRKVFFLVIITISAVFVGVIGVFSYQAYIEKQSPEKLTSNMLEALSKITSFNYDGSLDFNLNYQSSILGNSTSSVPLPDVVVDEKSTTTLSFFGSVSALVGKRPSFLLFVKAKLDRLNKDVFNTKLEACLIDDNLYLFLSNIDRLPLLDLRSLVGFWLSITPADMAKIGANSSITAPSVNQMLTWRNAVARTKMFSLTSKLGSEKINNNIDTVKYAFTLDLGESRDWLGQLITLAGSSDLSNQVSALASQNKLIGEIWLGVGDNLPYRVNINSVFRDDQKNSGANGNFSLDLNLKNFNKPVVISKPDSSRSLASVFEELLRATASSTKTKP